MTRDQILEAAAQIIREKGFHGASMQDIAEAVDLRKASLYHHVSSKQDILVGLLDIALSELIARMEKVVEQDISPEEKFTLAFRSYLGYLTENLGLASVLLLEHRSLEPEFREHHIPYRDRFESLWREVIAEGVEKEVLVCPDPSLAVKAVLGVANWTIMWFNPAGRLSAQEIADQTAAMLLNGFCKDKDKLC